jgi:EpsI family protein
LQEPVKCWIWGVMTQKSPAVDEYRIDRRSLLIGAALVGGAALAFYREPTKVAVAMPDNVFRGLIPRQVANWQSRKSDELVVPQEDDYTAKLYENLETFVYEGTNSPTMMLLLAYNSVQQNDVQAHRPEVCYPAGGYPIISSEELAVKYKSKVISGRYLIAERGPSSFEHIVYWIRIGDRFPTSWAQQRLDMALANASGIIPDGTLFRASTILKNAEKNSTQISDFISQFSRSADSKLGAILSG